MNPYDFARVDWERPPDRHPPVWHHRLVGQDSQQLYAGFLEVDVIAETPIFISDPRTVPQDPKRPAESIKNKQGEYIIPGSSLKGMLRCLAETLGNGCFTLFDGDYEPERRGNRTEYKAPYKRMIGDQFQHCSINTNLCIACRIFGMLRERTSGVFLGKVNIGDATTYADKVYTYEPPIYTAILMGPKPHHRDFYLDVTQRHITGRKYYFHHSPDVEPVTASGPIRTGNVTNRYIQPLDRDTSFHFRVDFTNLETDEFAALLLAIALEEDMRHKIGSCKPLGLGSIYLSPTSLTLVDYAARYTQPGQERGITVLKGDAMWSVFNQHIDEFSQRHLLQIAMDDLRRIWRWPPEAGVEYYYPNKRDWFDTEDSIGKRIADTKNVP